MKIIWASHPHLYSFHEESVGFLDKLLLKAKRDRPRFNRRMFDEDFARIFSTSGRSDRSMFKIISNDEDLSSRLLGDVRTQYGRCPVYGTIQKMVQDISEWLFCFGDSYYFLVDDHDQKKIHVNSATTDGIFRFMGVYLQFLPKRHERHLDIDDQEMPRELRILDRSKLMRFYIPKSVKQIISPQNAILASLDKYRDFSASLSPSATHENPNPPNNFDFRIWRDMQDNALWRATRKTGWNCRKFDSLKRSEFFDCHRLIRFRRNQLKLRDGILAQLSSEFTRVGKFNRAGFDFAVTPTSALPTVADLDELEARLSREEAGFTEVRDFCLKR